MCMHYMQLDFYAHCDRKIWGKKAHPDVNGHPPEQAAPRHGRAGGQSGGGSGVHVCRREKE